MDAIIRAAAITAFPRRLPQQGARAGVGATLPADDPSASVGPVQAALEQARNSQAQERAVAKARLDAADADLRQREEALAAVRRRLDHDLDHAHEAAIARGYQDGLERGLGEGRAEASAAAALRLQQLDLMAGEMAESMVAAAAASEDLLVEIAFEAICRMAGELAASRAATLAMVRAAAAKLRNARQLRIHLHPQDVKWLEENAGAMPNWTLVPDAEVSMGGCVVEGENGRLDARLEVQLASLRDVLLATRAARHTVAE
jgi:flagellar assembly protein FliH